MCARGGEQATGAPVHFSQQFLGSPGKESIPGRMSVTYRLLQVVNLAAAERWSIEWNHQEPSTSGVDSAITKVGLPINRKCIRAKYSPITPSVTSCTPENMAMVAARKGNPGTVCPVTNGRTVTQTRTPRPNSEVSSPKTLAAWSGTVLYPVAVSMANRRRRPKE